MKKNNYIVFQLTIIIIVFTNLTSGQSPRVTYTDITTESGIDFRYNFGDLTYQNILESSGSGVTILDFDNDGYMDLYMLNGAYLEGSPPRHRCC